MNVERLTAWKQLVSRSLSSKLVAWKQLVSQSLGSKLVVCIVRACQESRLLSKTHNPVMITFISPSNHTITG